MIKHNQDGAVSGVLVSLILTIILLVGAISFGVWAFLQRQDYKYNVDSKIVAAQEVTRQETSVVKSKEFAEKEKQPFKTYNGPEAYGSLVINYPKTWSGYVDASGGNSGTPVDGYFAPGVVPSVTNQTSVFALRVQVLQQSYADVLKSFSPQQQAGKLTISAYALPKLPKIVGVRVSGQLNNQKNVNMVVLPLRSSTLQISTEGSQYLADFDTNILPNFSFSP